MEEAWNSTLSWFCNWASQTACWHWIFQQVRHGKLLCTVNLARLADFKIEKYRKMVQICWFLILSLSYFGGLKSLKEHQVSIYRNFLFSFITLRKENQCNALYYQFFYNYSKRKSMQSTLLAILLLLLMVWFVFVMFSLFLCFDCLLIGRIAE